ncbi:hypothetical protein EsDP_00004678 [Epichloe bromicola]|uniref:Uncharacterized protein n=1 Tax=Epichloe bromicola TaxID=79588 RepID=A0ABQ0CSF6_9HYPO
MRTMATPWAVLAVLAVLAVSAASAASAVPAAPDEASVIATEPSTNITTVTVIPPPLSTGHTAPYHGNTTVVVPSCSAPYPISSTVSGSPIPSANWTGTHTTATGLPPVPTASNTGAPTAPPTAGATMNAQNSFLAIGIAVVMAALTL